MNAKYTLSFWRQKPDFVRGIFVQSAVGFGCLDVYIYQTWHGPQIAKQGFCYQCVFSKATNTPNRVQRTNSKEDWLLGCLTSPVSGTKRCTWTHCEEYIQWPTSMHVLWRNKSPNQQVASVTSFQMAMSLWKYFCIGIINEKQEEPSACCLLAILTSPFLFSCTDSLNWTANWSGLSCRQATLQIEHAQLAKKLQTSANGAGHTTRNRATNAHRRLEIGRPSNWCVGAVTVPI